MMNSNTKVFKVGIYLRLSREEEKLKESGSISTQRDLLLNYINEHNLLFVDEYIDDGVSGTTFDRSGFNKMIRDCESKKINMIITKDTSRLGRDHIEFGYYVEKYFPENNIRYVAVNDGIDTFSNNSSNDMLLFKSAFNDMYVKDISNKQRSSLYIKKKNGLFVGAYSPYGYNKSLMDKHILIINEDEALIVKRIFKMFVTGMSIQNICNDLTKEKIPTPSISKKMNIGQFNYHYGVWSTRTVNDILKNEIYIGNLVQAKQKKISYKSKKRIRNSEDSYIIVKNIVPRIIDDNTFKMVQNIFINNKKVGNNDKITDNLILRGLIYCKECSHTMGFRAQYQDTDKYGKVCRIYGNCNYWIKRKKENVCTPHSIKYDDIEKTVLREIKILLNDKKNNLENKIIEKLKNKSKNTNYNKEINKLENYNKSLKKKIEDCYYDKLNGIISIDLYKDININLNNQINENNKLIKKYEEQVKSLNKINKKDMITYILNKIIAPDKYIIYSLIERIEIDIYKNIYIHYKFSTI